MHREVVDRLLAINREFYQSFAEPFRATRGRLQPGVLKALERVSSDSQVLDLGCAHGLLAETLMQSGFSGQYVGLDSSQALLDSASQQLRPPQFQFALADLGTGNWPDVARSLLTDSEPYETDRSGHYDRVFAFAVLHHLPSLGLRTSAAVAIRKLLRESGQVWVSVWDFMASSRLRDRIKPWETADLAEADVDNGDYLLDWREGGNGVRYVHHFGEPELQMLADDAGFEVAEQYRSDGENGRLSIYQVWVPRKGAQ